MRKYLQKCVRKLWSTTRFEVVSLVILKSFTRVLTYCLPHSVLFQYHFSAFRHGYFYSQSYERSTLIMPLLYYQLSCSFYRRKRFGIILSCHTVVITDENISYSSYSLVYLTHNKPSYSLEPGIAHLVPNTNLVCLAPNGTNSGLFQIRFQYILAPKCTEI